jgi:hypothetical protein
MLVVSIKWLEKLPDPSTVPALIVVKSNSKDAIEFLC